MKLNKKIIILIIELLVVITTLVVVITTYAWYTSQTRVTTSQTYVYTASGASTEIIHETSPAYDTYSGQTGKDNADDAPYFVEKEITATFSPLQANSALQISFKSITIEQTDGTVISSSTDENVIPSFCWRIEYNDTVYMPDANNFAFYTDNEDRDYIIFNSTTTITFTIRIVYLSNEDYILYNAGNYGSITGFRYSGYEYMRSKFTITLEIGSDLLVVEGE